MMVHQGSHGTLSVGETIFSDRPTLHRERSGSVPPVSKHGPRSLTRTQGHAEKEEKERRSAAGVSWPPWFQQPRGPDPGGRSKVRPGHDDRVRSPKRKRVVGTYRIHQVGGDGLRLSRLQDARRAVSTTRAFPSLPEGSYSVCVPGPGVYPPGHEGALRVQDDVGEKSVRVRTRKAVIYSRPERSREKSRWKFVLRC